jgi:hypothetical protein
MFGHALLPPQYLPKQVPPLSKQKKHAGLGYVVHNAGNTS